MSAPVDVLAVLKRHVALAEQVGCREQKAEAWALFDAVEQLISQATIFLSNEKAGRVKAIHRANLAAALRAVGGAE